MGLIAAARGEVEAQGRGSLHPHTLVWLLLISLRQLLQHLLRNRAMLKQRLRSWMEALVHAVLSVQQSSVAQLPRLAQGPSKCTVPPLPFGPNELKYFRADGQQEIFTAEEAWTAWGEEYEHDRKLYFHRAECEGEEEWPEAVRPNLPLRNHHGDVVDKETWVEEFEASNKSLWANAACTSRPRMSARCSSANVRFAFSAAFLATPRHLTRSLTPLAARALSK